MRFIELVIFILCIYLLSILWILFDSIALKPFDTSFSVVFIDSALFSGGVEFGYTMIWISIGVNIIIVIFYRKFQSLTKLNVLKQDMKSANHVHISDVINYIEYCITELFSEAISAFSIICGESGSKLYCEFF